MPFFCLSDRSGGSPPDYLHVVWDALLPVDTLKVTANPGKVLITCSPEVAPEPLAALDPDIADAIVAMAEGRHP